MSIEQDIKLRLIDLKSNLTCFQNKWLEVSLSSNQSDNLRKLILETEEEIEILKRIAKDRGISWD